MSQANLEARVAQLEAQVADLLRRTNGSVLQEPSRDDWKATIGMFDRDPVMGEIIEETLKVREEDRQSAQPPSTSVT